ncbi:MAG: pyrroline-5-carboxylate reductase [Acidimicrobiales bacterium]
MAVTLLVAGGGKMGAAMLGGLLARGWAAAPDLAVVEPSEERRHALQRDHPGLEVLPSLDGAEAASALAGARDALLAVKPDVAELACRQLGGAGVTRVLSIVAGLPSQRLEHALGGACVVVRAMPNTPALVGAGVSAMAGGERATADDLDWAEGILGAVGSVARVPERLLDAVAGLSGCGPAYCFLVVEALVEGGVLVGLPRDLATTLAVATMAGSAALLAETGEAPDALRAAVTSPGGATAAGLRALEARGARSAFLEAVVAATERSRTLGH